MRGSLSFQWFAGSALPQDLRVRVERLVDRVGVLECASASRAPPPIPDLPSDSVSTSENSYVMPGPPPGPVGFAAYAGAG